MKTIDEGIQSLLPQGASDLLLSCGSPPRMRKDGHLELFEPDAAQLVPAETDRLVREMLQPDEWEFLPTRRQVDFAFTWKEPLRIRGNAYYQRDSLAVTLGLLPLEIPGFELLGVPESVHRLLERPEGLILVTGPTGPGKSTPQAAILEHINKTRPHHIITFEDPIAYIHKHRLSIVDQRQWVTTSRLAEGLRSAFARIPTWCWSARCATSRLCPPP